MKTPVDFKREIGEDNDAQQCRLLGLLCLIYGAFITLLVLIPNPMRGRLALLACGGMVLAVGGLLYWNSRRLLRVTVVPQPSIEGEPARPPGPTEPRQP
jgi:hypothetical protein